MERFVTLTVRQYVDGLVVPIEETEQAALEGLQRTVSFEDIRIELQVFGHVLPVEQLIHVGRCHRCAAACC